MKFICGYCGCKKRGKTKPPRIFPTWDDLIDHRLNAHRFCIQDNKLVRR